MLEIFESYIKICRVTSWLEYDDTGQNQCDAWNDLALPFWIVKDLVVDITIDLSSMILNDTKETVEAVSDGDHAF